MKKYINVKYILLAVMLGFVPFSASAATVYLDSSRISISVGDTVVVTAKINAEGVTINTVQGDIVLTSGASDVTTQEFSLANSAFGLWPRTPSLSSDKTDISFVGGVPGGFNIEGATLFSVIYHATKAGTVTITPKNIIAFANDGKGTKLSVTVKNLTINVATAQTGSTLVNDWGSVLAQDTTPPAPFIVVLGQDSSIYNGQKFAFFSAVDNQSGIAYYDVSENGAPVVRSGSTYVLQNQKGDVSLAVTAYDKAGNKRSATYPSSGSTGVSWLTVIISVLVILIVVRVYKKMNKKMRKNKNASPKI